MAENKKRDPAVRSSAAEYLTFVASAGESDASFEMRYEDENIWLTQRMMATLYDVDVQTISEHIKKVYDYQVGSSREGQLTISDGSPKGRRGCSSCSPPPSPYGAAPHSRPPTSVTS